MPWGPLRWLGTPAVHSCNVFLYYLLVIPPHLLLRAQDGTCGFLSVYCMLTRTLWTGSDGVWLIQSHLVSFMAHGRLEPASLKSQSSTLSLYTKLCTIHNRSNYRANERVHQERALQNHKAALVESLGYLHSDGILGWHQLFPVLIGSLEGCVWLDRSGVAKAPSSGLGFPEAHTVHLGVLGKQSINLHVG